jgi:PEP-CTERM motif
MKNIVFGITTFVLCASGLAQAEVVDLLNNGVYSTGVGPTGIPLSQGVVDTHYNFTQSTTYPGVFGTPNFAVAQTGPPTGSAPIGPWIANTGSSTWIGPNNDGSLGPTGYYDYRTTVDLSGFDAVSAILRGQWVTDNAGIDILVDGVSTGQSIAHGAGTAGDPYSFTHFTSFALTGFQPGENTIDFIVNNEPFDGPNPTGLQVNFTEATANTPEPGTFGLIGFGLLSVCSISGYKRRRNAGTSR